MTYEERIRQAESIPELTQIVHEISQGNATMTECRRLGGLVAERAFGLVAIMQRQEG